MLKAKELRKELHYDDNTGIFTRVKSKGKCKAGDIAGGLTHYGYITISVLGKRYPAHRLAWLYVSGSFPEDQIDHIDHDRTNNRFSNLREADNRTNAMNRGKYNTNTSGVVGVNWNEATNKWRAKITVEGQTVDLGTFVTFSHAVDARKNAEVLYGFHKNHGKDNA